MKNPSSPLLEGAEQAALRYARGPLVRIEPLGRGLIHDTFLVLNTYHPFVLQRINRWVFPDPLAVAANQRALNDYARGVYGRSEAYSLRLPYVMTTHHGELCYQDEAGEFWRAQEYIHSARSLSALELPEQAEAVGWALGQFHGLADSAPPGLLRETLPGFHIAPEYLARFDAVAARPRGTPDSPGLREALGFVAARRDGIGVLEQAKQAGLLRVRIIHGDPKLDNLLFDATGMRVESLIDLDTVQPGLIHYDIGDCLRSCCNRRGESGQDGRPAFDLGLCRGILKGYLAESRAFLSAADLEYLYPAIRLLPFELGLRFLTDHLAGDAYFKVSAPGQNLDRARAQFQLAESVEQQESRIRALISELA